MKWEEGRRTFESEQHSPSIIIASRATTQAAIPGQSGSGGSDTQNYCYDEQDRLVWAANNGTCGSATMSSTLGGNYMAKYAYTNLGQLWQGPQNGTGAQEQYLYCDSSHPHQLSNLSEVSSSPTCSSKGTIDYTGGYDAWGNTTSQQRGSTTKSTAYDAQDHLLHWSSTTNNQQEWYLYDASGERVLRRSFDGTNTTLTVYAFGLEEHQYAYSGSGSSATNNGNTYYYTLAGRLLGTWDGSSPTTTFLLTDSLGSVVSSFNNPSSGAVMQGNQLYGPYGNQRLKQGSVSTNKGFTGQYNDGLTGLDYDNARYYDPNIGLFLSADTVQGNAGGMDPYGYVGGNPESRTDPSGNLAYSPETGQVAIPQPDGRYEITGYNAGLNGTFNPKVTYTPVAFNPSSFWPKSAPAPTTHSSNNDCNQCKAKAWAYDADAVRNKKLADLEHVADLKEAGAGVLFVVGDILILTGGTPMAQLEALLDMASVVASTIIPPLANAVGNSNFYQAALHFSAWLMKSMAVVQGLLTVIKSAEGLAATAASLSAQLLVASVGGPAEIFIQGLMMLVRPAIGNLLDLGGHLLYSSAIDDFAEIEHQKNMPLPG